MMIRRFDGGCVFPPVKVQIKSAGDLAEWLPDGWMMTLDTSRDKIWNQRAYN
jgi:hypothetical protein